MKKREEKKICRQCWKDLFLELMSLDIEVEVMLNLIEEFNGYVGCKTCEKDGEKNDY